MPEDNPKAVLQTAYLNIAQNKMVSQETFLELLRTIQASFFKKCLKIFINIFLNLVLP